jgi:hypothetical protein
VAPLSRAEAQRALAVQCSFLLFTYADARRVRSAAAAAATSTAASAYGVALSPRDFSALVSEALQRVAAVAPCVVVGWSVAAFVAASLVSRVAPFMPPVLVDGVVRFGERRPLAALCAARSQCERSGRLCPLMQRALRRTRDESAVAAAHWQRQRPASNACCHSACRRSPNLHMLAALPLCRMTNAGTLYAPYMTLHAMVKQRAITWLPTSMAVQPAAAAAAAVMAGAAFARAGRRATRSTRQGSHW